MKKEYKIGVAIAIILIVGVSSIFLINNNSNEESNGKDHYFKGYPFITEIPCDSGREIRQNLSNKRHYVVSKDLKVLYRNLSNEQLLSYIESKEISCYRNGTDISTCVNKDLKIICKSGKCEDVFLQCDPQFN